MTIHNTVVGLLDSRGVAHPDVKPGNRVCTNDFRLQIIEFNTAVGVASEDHMVEGVYGAEGWMAPEIRGLCSVPFRPTDNDPVASRSFGSFQKVGREIMTSKGLPRTR